MIDRMPREGYGFGIIRLTTKLAVISTELYVFNLIEASDVQGRLRDMGILDKIKQSLRLPDDYAVIAVYIEPPRMTWCVLIEAPGVPIPDEGEDLPVLMPRYHRDVDGQTGEYGPIILDRVDISPDPRFAMRAD